MTHQDTLPFTTATGVRHVCLPDFSVACGLTYLDLPPGDRVSFGSPGDWRTITCDWCRSLGRTYCRAAVARMQGRAA